ncbi:MAG: uracil-DNA glycosylase [Candidatus Taylorbacteria bacterium RIFCSPHIGHO2_02_FULL_47_18]|uniref:Uracil-DNA glycosylase n=1 Tax=Candidatus Taylorbacteria bacterium RIFCSPLOWO2_01_FULL_48_100 TaxID=1802322 RepID=A0A1G2NIB4_9BACT|nr:MAG: uracil-DNA glycosylase [Candidatus Taylorbacteria bacterium RIFCSPHIGHO2_02_FULL_47_18]OHA35141.1 MAG: uracil-DNA glycosylase [Candidatus Taylorbacteria bacterium RIFCSPLOWO2_01_FULL_48_100]OHA41054.1 MAG: uracil-DNA glycosylase [Candidatus Taylorbacteria bacterium RIFCSPLOWO2_02_FULL_48_16]OHA45268.1 MAG: uracil-DNA glycosylase [Candidatus Taylorbacteria bacterium RIFCSPLOWO2_12_FULL_48_11]
MIKIEPSWGKVLAEEFEKPYFKNLAEFIRGEYLSAKVFPPPRFIFRAFELCPFGDTKIVLLGQDPYHGDGQAHGLCFSVPEKEDVPPSLANIYKEIANDVGGTPPTHGNLEEWAKQGVLLLNATLTVRAHSAGSHQGKGWEEFTDAVIKKLSAEKENLVFLLWGNYAKKKSGLVDWEKHLALEAAHPSPFSAHSGFFGCKHFSQTNDYLTKHSKEPIRWV